MARPNTPWFRCYAELTDHPKTRRLARATGLSLNETIGTLIRLWSFTVRYAADGNLEDYTASELEDAVGWQGQPGDYVRGLSAAKLVDVSADGHLAVHNWLDNGADCYKDAERKRLKRQKEREQRVRGQSADSPRKVPVRREEKRLKDRSPLPPKVAPPPLTLCPPDETMMDKAAPATPKTETPLAADMLDAQQVIAAIAKAVNDPNYSGHRERQRLAPLMPCHADEVRDAIAKVGQCKSPKAESRWAFIASCLENGRTQAKAGPRPMSMAYPMAVPPKTVPATVIPFRASAVADKPFADPQTAKQQLQDILSMLGTGMAMPTPGDRAPSSRGMAQVG